MNIQTMINEYRKEGLSAAFASARVCQDIVLKAISVSSLSENVTIKGGIVMRSASNDKRRATRDIDLDFIHYSIEDSSVLSFINRLNCLEGIVIRPAGSITELKHKDYHGKRVELIINDNCGNEVMTKMDIGVHTDMEISQEEYCFDVCMDDEGVSLLRNTYEQVFTEKLRSLLRLGTVSRRYKDIYDLYFLINIVNAEKLKEIIRILIFRSEDIYENSYADIARRLERIFSDKEYLKNVSTSRQRWLDDDIAVITTGIVGFIEQLS